MHDFPTPDINTEYTSVTDDNILEQVRIRTHFIFYFL